MIEVECHAFFLFLWIMQGLSWFGAFMMLIGAEPFDEFRTKKRVITAVIPFGYLVFIYHGIIEFIKYIAEEFNGMDDE